MTVIIDINPVEPARIGFRQARGVSFNRDFLFRENQAPLRDIEQQSPQLIFRPKSDLGASAYDLMITNPANGGAHLDVPGSFFSDPRGYLTELYFRDSDGHPTRLVANGVMSLSPGGAYQFQGPLFPASLPTGPVGASGPAGPTGPQGVRGGVWTTGSGAPTIHGTEVEGDMYLDESNGDVWRYSSGLWSRGTF